MEALVVDWLTLLLRWLHVITAIAWIGASFYFVWLDLSLENPPESRQREGFKGELWSIHGGGIYRSGKFASHPEVMPNTLHWFKWEAYSTWLTGTGLLIVLYYFKADAYLMGGPWLTTPMTAVFGSVGYLLGGLAVYEISMRYLARTTVVEVTVMVLLVVIMSWLAFQLFAPRAAILHLGAGLATMMAANVFLTIIPSQKAFIAAIEAAREADLNLAINAKRRSTHNNYLTLPVLFCMLANHAAFVYGHQYAWAYLIAFCGLAALARHYFNAKHAGRVRPGILLSAALGFVLVTVMMAWTTPQVARGTAAVSIDQVDHIVQTHCLGCHATAPTVPGFATAPAGIVFGQANDLLAHRTTVTTSLQTNFMPLGNLTQMSAAERQQVLDWVAAQ